MGVAVQSTVYDVGRGIYRDTTGPRLSGRMGHPRYFGNVPTTIQRETSSPEGASDVTMSDAEFFCMSNRTTKLDLKAMYMFDAVHR